MGLNMLVIQTNIRESSKQKRKAAILESAEKLFLQKGIDNTTMNDIAKETNIGVATLFRYFPKKEIIIITIATSKLQIILTALQEIDKRTISCIEKLSLTFDFFIEQMSEKNGTLPKLLDNFINYSAISNVSLENMEIYTNVRREITTQFIQMIENGKMDHSIRSDIEITPFISTIFSNFSVFTLKLSLKSNVKLIEPELPSQKQLQIMKTIFLDYLKPKSI